VRLLYIMPRHSMKGGSPASRLVMSGVKTSDSSCNEKFQAAYNTHDLSGMNFHMTTGGGKKKRARKASKGRKSKARKGRKSRGSTVMSQSKNKFILYGNSRKKRSKKGGNAHKKNNVVVI
jgi:hypothetical protein